MGSVVVAPSFPIPILVAVTALLAIPLYLAARGLRGDAARFLIGAIWLRYILSVFHVITYRDFGAGLSLTAVGSILVTGFGLRSEEHTSELQSLMRNSSAVFCLKKKNNTKTTN